MTFLDTLENFCIAMKAASSHVAAAASLTTDRAVHATLHRLSVTTNEAARQISDLLASTSPELRRKIDAILVEPPKVAVPNIKT